MIIPDGNLADKASESIPRPSPLPSPPRSGWVKVPESFLDGRVVPLTPSEKIILLNIEVRARDSCYAFPGTEDLARRSRRSHRATRRILDRLEAKGYIRSVMMRSGHPYRLCFLLLRRANPDRPVFVPGRDDLDQVVEIVCRKRGIPKPLYGFKDWNDEGVVLTSSEGVVLTPCEGVVLTPKTESLSLNQSAIQEDSLPLVSRAPEGTEGDKCIDLRQRPEDAAEVALTCTTVTATGAPGTAPGPAPARVAVPVDRPPADCRARPGVALGRGKSAAAATRVSPRRLLGCEVARIEAPADDPVVAAELARRARAKEEAAAAPAPKPPPTDTAELIRRLPGDCPASWAQVAAEDLARKFGNKQDRRLWGQFQLIMKDVWGRDLDAELVVDAYRQAMKPECKKPGAVFWTALKRHLGREEDGPS
jgi:hypothetical protein